MWSPGGTSPIESPILGNHFSSGENHVPLVADVVWIIWSPRVPGMSTTLKMNASRSQVRDIWIFSGLSLSDLSFFSTLRVLGLGVQSNSPEAMVSGTLQWQIPRQTVPGDKEYMVLLIRCNMYVHVCPRPFYIELLLVGRLSESVECTNILCFSYVLPLSVKAPSPKVLIDPHIFQDCIYYTHVHILYS